MGISEHTQDSLIRNKGVKVSADECKTQIPSSLKEIYGDCFQVRIRNIQLMLMICCQKKGLREPHKYHFLEVDCFYINGWRRLGDGRALGNISVISYPFVYSSGLTL